MGPLKGQPVLLTPGLSLQPLIVSGYEQDLHQSIVKTYVYVLSCSFIFVASNFFVDTEDALGEQ